MARLHGAWRRPPRDEPFTRWLTRQKCRTIGSRIPTKLADNVARLRLVLGRQDGPTIVAGHSYGGQIMTALGTDAPNVGRARVHRGVRA